MGPVGNLLHPEDPENSKGNERKQGTTFLGSKQVPCLLQYSRC